MSLLSNKQPGQQLMVSHKQNPGEPSSSSSSFCNWSPACLCSPRRRPHVAGRRSARSAGGLKAPTEVELPTVPRSSTPGKVYLYISHSTNRRKNRRDGNSSTAAAPPATGWDHRLAVHRHLETFWRRRSVRSSVIQTDKCGNNRVIKCVILEIHVFIYYITTVSFSCESLKKKSSEVLVSKSLKYYSIITSYCKKIIFALQLILIEYDLWRQYFS